MLASVGPFEAVILLFPFADSGVQLRKKGFVCILLQPHCRNSSAPWSGLKLPQLFAIDLRLQCEDIQKSWMVVCSSTTQPLLNIRLIQRVGGGTGSLRGLKLSADAAPFQPSAGIMSRTKSCGSLSQDGERDMVSVSVR